MLSLVVQRQERLKLELPFLSKVRADVIRIWEQSRGLVHQISQSTKNLRTLAIKNKRFIAPKYEHQLFRKNSYNIKNSRMKRSCKQVIRI